MGSAEMGLELELCAMRTVDGFVKETTSSAMECGERGRAARLEDSIRSLEGERRKIEAFKRELPLCMHLLCEVIKELRREIDRCRGESLGHVFEEFLPIKSKAEGDGGAKGESDFKDKMNWMSSVQLWSDNCCQDNNDDKKTHKIISEEKDGGIHHRDGECDLLSGCKSQNGVSFVPFKELSSTKEKDKPAAAFPDLSLRSPSISSVLDISADEDPRVAGFKIVGRLPESPPVTIGSHFSFQSHLQQPRKSRRCWSQDLHRRFVLAIQQLGGAQVATPKQIRELMKVDGLTNDEVKSHLQKYRLHTRKAPNNASASANRTNVAGGMWASEELYTSSSQQSGSQSGSPMSPLQLACSARALAVDSSEEDGKSESYSWK